MSPYRLNGFRAMYEDALRVSSMEGACNWITVARVSEQRASCIPLLTRIRGLSKGARTMSIHIHNPSRGARHRAKIERWILPKLQPGCRVPSANWMARFLDIAQ